MTRALLALVCLVATAAAGELWIRQTPVPALDVALSEEVLGRDGALLAVFTAEDGRWRLAPATVDPDYIDLLIAYEDQRFYRHPGVDPLALMRAAGDALWSRRIRAGGSTLTMQVARLLEEGSTGRWAGKLRQIRLALALERRLSKAEILELYLTRAPFGGNLEGVRSASLAYFGREPQRLTLAEAALLVALPQAPEARRPDRASAEILQSARGRVIARGLTANLFSERDAARARAAPVPRGRRPMPSHAPHLAAHLVQGEERQTTLDVDLQATLETLLAAHVGLQDDPALSGAVLVADHRSGEILARLGSSLYADPERRGYVDMTRAVRSPGSALKPLVYGLGFEAGQLHPETRIEDRPARFGTWHPVNFDGRFLGTVTVRDALLASRNLPAVAVLEAVGPVRMLSRLHRVDVATQLPPGAKPGLAIALGGLGVTLEGLVQTYAGLAGGSARLHDRPGAGGSLPDLITPVSAHYVRDILRDGGGIAAKTGTSYGFRDAWAIGFDGRHVVGVWLGRADGGAVPGLTGARAARPLLDAVFDRLGPTPAPFPPPPRDALPAQATDLPPPLRRYLHRQAADPGVVLAFPPDGARIDFDPAEETKLLLRAASGTPPYAFLVNGAVAGRTRLRPEIEVDIPLPGRYDVTVMDAAGETARAYVLVK
ncbi:MAG: penicillin-binding protein 1C [Pseudomonadota bacterium]